MWAPYGTLPCTPDEWWPDLAAAGLGATVGEYADFSYDATALITVNGVVDPVVGFTVAAAPSGAGEVVVSSLSLTGNVVAGWLTGGVPGRTYLYQIVITTAAGRKLPVLIGQVCTNVLAGNPVPVAPSPGFGTPVTWP